jgi:hypothetical protein
MFERTECDDGKGLEIGNFGPVKFAPKKKAAPKKPARR